ncbi:MAG: inositol monophosphatase family protein [Phycisphaeraceae bacterium]|nr:inositol monophosphatase family protein [Phycisphaeraceae bacterium]
MIPHPDADVERRLSAARELAHAAGDLANSYFNRAGLRVEEKSDGSPVTRADREAEQLIRRVLADRFPDDGVLGEEFGESTGTSGWRWIVDPIDGTASFVRGVPLWGTMIAAERAGECTAGVITLAALGETVWAASGGGAWHAARPDEFPQPARVSTVDAIGSALCCTTSTDYFSQAGQLPAFGRLAESFNSIRGWSDCSALVLVATGRIDAVVEPVMKPWDMAAAIPILREAGGRCTDWHGNVTAHGGAGVATNGRIHDELITLLNRK